MFLAGHFAAGYLVTYLLLNYFHIDPFYRNTFLLLGAIAGVLPDLDVLAHFRKARSLKLGSNGESHRDFITHAPIVWLLIGSLIIFFGDTFSTELSGIILILGTWTHFIIDTLEYGIRWGWPFSKKNIAVFKNAPKHNLTGKESNREYYKKMSKEIYFKTKSFYIEIVLIAMALILFFKLHRLR